ncbi:MAG TPA: hypothetical protein VIV60_32400 [Polyangiaceae bacterium]
MPVSSALLLKLTLAPMLVGLASLIAFRVGPRLGGVVTALPVVTGPLLWLYSIEQGQAFAAAAASRTLVGTLALLAYCLAYAGVAQVRSRQREHASGSRLNVAEAQLWPWLCMLVGWAAFIVAAAILGHLRWTKATGVALALAAVVTGLSIFRHVAQSSSSRFPGVLRIRLLLLRMGAAGLLVSSLATAAAQLGPAWSGLLAAFPVVSTVMLVATHLERGWGGALAWLRGFYVGLFGYVAFVSVIAYALVSLGNLRAFMLGLAAAILTQALVTRVPSR